MDTLIAFAIAVVITGIFFARYVLNLKRREIKAREAAERGELFTEGPKGQHPHIDNARCIGCGGCTEVCPEGDVLAMMGGKAVIVNGYKCIGHGLCAEACPVGAITMVRSNASMGADMPRLTAQYETSVPNIFIVGELGGLALIKNAVNEGRDCIDIIAERQMNSGTGSTGDVYDVVIVGAGPAGISASLRAIERKLKYLTIEQDEVGGTVAKYPRQKLVMTSPVELPLYGKMNKREVSKENLLELWHTILGRADFNIRTHEKLESVQRGTDGELSIVTTRSRYQARSVVLALGRAGTPKKLGVKGEELPKVMYRLIETDHYRNKKVLVVGGGDSAVEAAMGLAHQPGNEVTLSYRKEAFSRIKERNLQRIQSCMASRKINVIFNSQPVEFRSDSVLLETAGGVREISNDYVWIFAGGNPPSELLQTLGVQFGMRDMTLEGSREAKQAHIAEECLVTSNNG